MTVIFLPVEVVQREFWGKAILASYLAAKGHKIYIFQDYLFDKHGYPEPGIYIGKNLFKTWGRFSLDAKLKAMNDGITMYFLEEEALGRGASPEQATEEYFKSRFGTLPYVRESLNSEHGDRFLAWSKLHAETARGLLPDNKINTTGSPIFASCKPEWKEIYKSFAPAVEQPYVLVCSSYSFSIGISIYEFLKMTNEQCPGFDKSEHLIFHAEAIHFATTIKKIAGKLRNIPFLFRPHPSENCDIYDELFADSPNVLVSKAGTIQEVLINTRALIHSGCSTAIQARIMGIPIITLDISPDKFLYYPMRLMNLGYKCTEWEAVCTYIKETDNTIKECEWEFEEHIDTNNTFEKIVDLIDIDSAIHSPSRTSKRNTKNHIKDNIRKLYFKLSDLSKPYQSSSSLSGWSIKDFNRFTKAVKFISQRKFNKDIWAQKLTSNCHIFSDSFK